MNGDRYLNVFEVQALLAAPDNMRDKSILHLLYYGGVKVGELVKTLLADVDWQGSRVRVGGRWVPLDVLSMTVLRLYVDTERRGSVDYLFPGSKGKTLSRRNVEYIVKRYCENGVTPGVLRATFAFHAHESGVKICDLSIRMGYKKDNDLFCSIFNKKS